MAQAGRVEFGRIIKTPNNNRNYQKTVFFLKKNTGGTGSHGAGRAC